MSGKLGRGWGVTIKSPHAENRVLFLITPDKSPGAAQLDHPRADARRVRKPSSYAHQQQTHKRASARVIIPSIPLTTTHVFIRSTDARRRRSAKPNDKPPIASSANCSRRRWRGLRFRRPTPFACETPPSSLCTTCRRAYRTRELRTQTSASARRQLFLAPASAAADFNKNLNEKLLLLCYVNQSHTRARVSGRGGVAVVNEARRCLRLPLRRHRPRRRATRAPAVRADVHGCHR